MDFSEKVSEKMKLIIIGDDENNIIRKEKPLYKNNDELLDLIKTNEKILEQEREEIIDMDQNVGKSCASFQSISEEIIEKQK